MFAFLTPTFLIGILIALSVHECAHAYVASKLGDDTARLSGRLTLNPLAHLDPLGTILFLVVGFGWGKPVPVAPSAFRHPRRDSALTSLAGPASNLLLAAVCFVLLIAIAPSSMGNGAWDLLAPPVQTSVLHTFLVQLLSGSLFINLGLMAFNLLPVAPLDGSKILEAFIPLRFDEVYATFLRWGPSILLGLLLAERVVGIGLLSGWIGGIMDGVLGVFAMVAGLVIR
ncbi:site-2 protease family protein [Candidatus Peregrinibacteria bacterium]|nr:site-2 protease family protein [Candidatus Peregrinibacteria bacterium]MBI3816538.1 site-2 protease family protein [Candidatus Peregrinibacteria bacterium]